jgi:hypothetical protein
VPASGTTDVVLDLSCVAGRMTWTGDVSGDLYAILCVNTGAGAFGYDADHEVIYSGIGPAASAPFAIELAPGESGTYYLLGFIAPSGQGITSALRAGWYADASAATASKPPPVDLGSLSAPYDFGLLAP